MDLKQAILEHALEHPREEVCGLVVSWGKNKFKIIRALNLAEDRQYTFDLDPAAWLHVQPGEEVVGIYHSHPNGPPTPSMADLSGCEATGLTWHIVSPGSGEYHSFEPSGYEAPLLKRPYVHGVHDCYSIVRDWYAREMGLKLDDFDRDNFWWEREGVNLYVDNFESQGFVQLIGEAPRRGDAFLIQVGSSKPNHAAVCLGDGTILHHVAGRLSCIEPWDGFYSQFCTHHLRHKSML